MREASCKKNADFSSAEFLTIDEGLCVQMLHVGAFDDEPASTARMDEYIAGLGYENDFSDIRLHHEIYLSDARRIPHLNGGRLSVIRSNGKYGKKTSHKGGA